MAASPRERRPAVWPWLVMPLIVLAAFYALLRMHHRLGTRRQLSGAGARPGAGGRPRSPRTGAGGPAPLA